MNFRGTVNPRVLVLTLGVITLRLKSLKSRGRVFAEGMPSGMHTHVFFASPDLSRTE